MIVDVHVHAFPDAIAVRAMGGMARAGDGVLTPVGDGTMATLLDRMACDGVDKAVLCQIATKPAQFDVLFRTACAIRDGALGERARERLIPFPSVHPADPDARRHLDMIASAGFRGVKFHPYYQDFRLDDPSVRPLFEQAAALGLVVLCHCGHDVGYPDRRDACGPAEVAALLRRVRGLTFIAAHMGGCAGYPPHATDPMRDLGCYIDTSALARNWMRDEETRLLRAWPTDRILFASDFPWTLPAEAIRRVREVREPADWEALFAGNARRLLGV